MTAVPAVSSDAIDRGADPRRGAVLAVIDLCRLMLVLDSVVASSAPRSKTTPESPRADQDHAAQAPDVRYGRANFDPLRIRALHHDSEVAAS